MSQYVARFKNGAGDVRFLGSGRLHDRLDFATWYSSPSAARKAAKSFKRAYLWPTVEVIPLSEALK